MFLLGMLLSASFVKAAVAGETVLEPAEALKILQQVQSTSQLGLPNDTLVKRECAFSPEKPYAFWSKQATVHTVQSESHIQRDAAAWQIKSTIQLISPGDSPLVFDQQTFWDGSRWSKWQSSTDYSEKASGETTVNAKRKNDFLKDPYLGYELDGILTHRDYEDIGHLMIRKEADKSARIISNPGEDALIRFEAVSGLWHIQLWTDTTPNHAIRKMVSTAQFKPSDDFRYSEGRETVLITKTAVVNGISIPVEGSVETVKVLRPLQRTNNQSLLGWLWNKYTASLQEQTRVTITRVLASEPKPADPARVLVLDAGENTVFHCPDEPPKDLVWNGTGFVDRNESLSSEDRLNRGVRLLRISPTGPGGIEIGWMPSIPWAGGGLGGILLLGAWGMRLLSQKRQGASDQKGN